MSKGLMRYTRKDGKVVECVRGREKRKDTAGVRPQTGIVYGLTELVDRKYAAWCQRRGFKP